MIGCLGRISGLAQWISVHWSQRISFLVNFLNPSVCKNDSQADVKQFLSIGRARTEVIRKAEHTEIYASYIEI